MQEPLLFLFSPTTHGPKFSSTNTTLKKIPTSTKIDHLEKLERILENKKRDLLVPCIKDLVANGLCLSRVSENEPTPSRQDVTQFIGTWFYMLDIPVDECREWMVDYCVDVLSVHSSSSLSQIRHSTKSNIKFIYGKNVPFECNCENNRFKAHCNQKCPIYEKMALRAKVKAENEQKERAKIEKISEEVKRIAKERELEKKLKEKKRGLDAQEKRQKKKAFYEKIYTFAETKLRENFTKLQIVDLLNKAGYRTETGRLWTYHTLLRLLKKYKDIIPAGEDFSLLFTEKDFEMTKNPPKTSSRKSTGRKDGKKAVLRPNKDQAEYQQTLFFQ